MFSLSLSLLFVLIVDFLVFSCCLRPLQRDSTALAIAVSVVVVAVVDVASSIIGLGFHSAHE